MQKSHIRTYGIADTGDIRVTGWRAGDNVDLSKHYREAAHDRRHSAVGATLEVFRYEDDRIGWALSPTGHDLDSAQTIALLFELLVEDSARESDDPRAL
jgi:hypothetical protein